MKNLQAIAWVAILGACTSSPSTPPIATVSLNKYSEPIFEDSASFARLNAAFPVIDKVFKDYAAKNNMPAIAYGIIAGGKLVYAGSAGLANIEKNTNATPQTLFRIA